MGWLWLAVIGVAAFALLWWGGISRTLGTFTAAALLVGGAGYALQNNASLPGSPARPDARQIAIDPDMVAFRTAIMPGVADDTAILAAADDRMEQGDTAGAALLIMQAIDRRPDDAALWTGLGNVLMAHGGGTMSPAARLAFSRALRVGPDQPGPRFFLGMAYVQGDDFAAAKREWLKALALSPSQAPYRLIIAERLVLIDRFIAMKEAASAPR